MQQNVVTSDLDATCGAGAASAVLANRVATRIWNCMSIVVVEAESPEFLEASAAAN